MVSTSMSRVTASLIRPWRYARVRACASSGGKDIGCDQLVDRGAELISQLDGPGCVALGDHPLEGHGRIEDVFHSGSSPRSSRMAGTPMSRSPCGR